MILEWLRSNNNTSGMASQLQIFELIAQAVQVEILGFRDRDQVLDGVLHWMREKLRVTMQPSPHPDYRSCKAAILKLFRSPTNK